MARAIWMPGLSSSVSSVGMKPSGSDPIVEAKDCAAMKVTADTEP